VILVPEDRVEMDDIRTRDNQVHEELEMIEQRNDDIDNAVPFRRRCERVGRIRAREFSILGLVYIEYVDSEIVN